MMHFAAAAISMALLLTLLVCAPLPHQQAGAAGMEYVENLIDAPASAEENEGLLHVDANVICPALDMPVVCYSVEYGGGGCDMERFCACMMPDAEVRTSQMPVDEPGGSTQCMQIAELADALSGGVQTSARCCSGCFKYIARLPDDHYSPHKDGGAGVFEPNGIAKVCGMSVDDAKSVSQHFVAMTGADIDMGQARCYAISPSTGSRYKCGYYVVHVPQTIDGIPVCVSNAGGVASSVKKPDYLPPINGFALTVFDGGVERAIGFWLDGASAEKLSEHEKLISLESAIAVLREWAGSELRTRHMTVREIRFEYILSQSEQGITIVPAWSFDTLSKITSGDFCGVQISAIDGSILRAVSEFQLPR